MSCEDSRGWRYAKPLRGWGSRCCLFFFASEAALVVSPVARSIARRGQAPSWREGLGRRAGEEHRSTGTSPVVAGRPRAACWRGVSLDGDKPRRGGRVSGGVLARSIARRGRAPSWREGLGRRAARSIARRGRAPLWREGLGRRVLARSIARRGQAPSWREGLTSDSTDARRSNSLKLSTKLPQPTPDQLLPLIAQRSPANSRTTPSAPSQKTPDAWPELLDQACGKTEIFVGACEKGWGADSLFYGYRRSLRLRGLSLAAPCSTGPLWQPPDHESNQLETLEVDRETGGVISKKPLPTERANGSTDKQASVVDASYGSKHVVRLIEFQCPTESIWKFKSPKPCNASWTPTLSTVLTYFHLPNLEKES